MVVSDDIGPVVGIGLGTVLLQERDIFGDLRIVLPGRVARLLEKSGGDVVSRRCESAMLYER
jgi:hypothetical protein